METEQQLGETMNDRYTAIMQLGVEGKWEAVVNQDSGIFTFGDTVGETVKNVREAVAVHLDVADDAFELDFLFSEKELRKLINSRETLLNE